MTNDQAAEIGADGPTTIVALGASAGGLEALQGFFRAMPGHPRLAFVVITHLSPQHASHMAELLARVTTMPVAEAKDGERVQAGRVYVIPPNRLMGIRAGALTLEQAAPRPGVPHPIDHFMCALAEDQQERCVGIVLSGADHDGTVGLKEIKAAGGMAMVQDPGTAQYPSMPSSAIAAGVPDLVLPVERMGQALLDYVVHTPADLALNDPAQADSPPGDLASPPPGEGAGLPARLQEIFALLQARTGHDFRCYRPAMLLRRLRRRMGLKALDDVSGYLALLKDSDEEINALLKDFLISITEFFREPEAWRTLEEQAIPRLLQGRTAGSAPVRVWTPGCATGEESYSIAMVLLEQLGASQGDRKVHVFASDVDTEALQLARRGSYPQAISAAVSPARLARFFEKSADRYVVRKGLREAVLFAPQDLVRDPPFSKLDIIVCRNVLIYFEPVLQGRILELFHFALNPDGILFLGKSESLGAQANLFEPISRTHRIFRRVGLPSHLPRGFVGSWSGQGYLTPPAKPYSRTRGLAQRMREQLAQRSAIAAVLINRDQQALYFHGETGRYLQPTGEPTADLLSLMHEGLRSRLRTVLQQAIAEGRGVPLTVRIRRDARLVQIDIQVEPLEDFRDSGLLLVRFEEPPATNPAAAEGEPSEANEPAVLSALEEELRSTRSELLVLVQEAESANSELRVANEEAMSMNEELQSSNEELESSKEELQSLNEEMSTVNSELEDKLAELERALNDLRNLFDSTRVATLFLDRELRIRRFTPETTRLFNLIGADAGRPLADIASRVADADLFSDSRGVMQSLSPAEKEVGTVEGQWFLRRILPYRTGNETVEGVVVTYTDITALRMSTQEARRLATVLRDSHDAVIVHDLTGRILAWNRGAERAYGYDKEAALGLNMAQLEPIAQGGTALTLAERLRESGSADPASVQRVTRDGHILNVSVTVSALRDEAGSIYAMVSTERDITEQLRLEGEVRFRAMADDIPTLLRIEDATGQAQFLNRAWLEFTGESAQEALLAHGWLKYIHPEDRPAYLHGLQEASREARRFDQDLRLRRVDGAYRWMRSTAVARFDHAGRVLGYVSVSVDIEERKRAEEDLARVSERKDEFLAMLAHELRNPLAPIRNAVDLIERLVPAEPKIAWGMGVIARQTQQLTRLVDDLMDVARIATGKVSLAREPIELSVLIERACDVSQPLIDARRQSLTVTVPPEPLYVEGDLMRLTQVIGNLLNNAAKYSGEGGAIALAVSASATHVEISVTDNGAGIAPEVLPRVFDLFVQADKTLDRAQGGLGIGLTLVQRLVRAHGGSVEARSAGLGRGSQFLVRLPLLHLAQPAALEPRAAPAVQKGLGRVMVVDDNVDNASTTAMLLEEAGHVVRVAHDGAQALGAIAEFRPDVVVLDIGLPGMSGYDLARNLRGRRETAHARLIALTGYGQPEDEARAKAAGFDHHLVKPVPPEQLVALVGQLTPS